MVYHLVKCSECEGVLNDVGDQVADLLVGVPTRKHKPTCTSLAARVERGETLSDAEVLVRVIAEWRERNGAT
jgi:hypothetical protein